MNKVNSVVLWYHPVRQKSLALPQQVPTVVRVQTLCVPGGDLPTSEVLKALDTGVWIGIFGTSTIQTESAGRMTGDDSFCNLLGRERYQIVAPLNVMRFDDTIHRMLGSELEALTVEQDLLLSASSYYNRSDGFI